MGRAKPKTDRMGCLQAVILEVSQDLADKASLLREALEADDMISTCCDIRLCNPETCPYRQRAKQILSHTIEELEATRKAFKSRQLEALRKKLLKDLARI
jgi:hypothetical protein